MTKLVGVNQLEEVTDPILFETGNVPTKRGLLSTEIFGSTLSERKNKFAYIDLHGHYLQPFVFKMLKRMNRNFESIVNGSKKFIIDTEGQLVQDDEKGQTGVDWLYKNWNKLVFKKNNSVIRNERIDLLQAYDRDILFVKYWDVQPAYYRDVNLQSTEQGKVSHHEVNDLYSRLIRLAQMVRDGNQFDFALVSTQSRIQMTLVEIYDLMKGKLEKKNGLIRKSLLGKSIDYGSRSVISAPIFDVNRSKDMEVDFYHTGVPLAQVCALFTPFITGWVKNFFRREIERFGNKYPIADKDGKIVRYVKLKSPESHFNEEYLKKVINRFVHSPANRFETIELPVDEKEDYKGKVFMAFIGSGTPTDGSAPDEVSPLIKRKATWTDILYQAAVDVTSDKMIWITRYPLLDYFGMFPSKIRVMTTTKTTPMYVGDKVYDRYPVVDFDIPYEELSVYFIDTVRMSNLYLAGLGGDRHHCLPC